MRVPSYTTRVVVAGVVLDVEYEYEAAEADSRDCKGTGEYIGVVRVEVAGVDILSLLCDDCCGKIAASVSKDISDCLGGG